MNRKIVFYGEEHYKECNFSANGVNSIKYRETWIKHFKKNNKRFVRITTQSTGPIKYAITGEGIKPHLHRQVLNYKEFLKSHWWKTIKKYKKSTKYCEKCGAGLHNPCILDLHHCIKWDSEWKGITLRLISLCTLCHEMISRLEWEQKQPYNGLKLYYKFNPNSTFNN